jgi:uncharacterized membrane protein
MKKPVLALAMVLVLASCGGSNHEDCKDCNVTDTTVVDTTPVDTTKRQVGEGSGREVTPVATPIQ